MLTHPVRPLIRSCWKRPTNTRCACSAPTAWVCWCRKSGSMPVLPTYRPSPERSPLFRNPAPCVRRFSIGRGPMISGFPISYPWATVWRSISATLSIIWAAIPIRLKSCSTSNPSRTAVALCRRHGPRPATNPFWLSRPAAPKRGPKRLPPIPVPWPGRMTFMMPPSAVPDCCGSRRSRNSSRRRKP